MGSEGGPAGMHGGPGREDVICQEDVMRLGQQLGIQIFLLYLEGPAHIACLLEYVQVGLAAGPSPAHEKVRGQADVKAGGEGFPYDLRLVVAPAPPSGPMEGYRDDQVDVAI